MKYYPEYRRKADKKSCNFPNDYKDLFGVAGERDLKHIENM